MTNPTSETRIRKAADLNDWRITCDEHGLVTFRKGRHYVDVMFDTTGRVRSGGSSRINRRLTTAAAVIEILAR